MHEHSAGCAVIRDGPQRLTHSSAPGSLRYEPPGQHQRSSMLARRSVSSVLRPSIEATIEGTDGSRAGWSMATDYPIGRPSNRLEKRGASPAGAAHRAPSKVLGALRHARDGVLVVRHLPGDALVRVAVGHLQVVDDEAAGGQVPPEVFRGLERAQLILGTVDLH